MPCPLVAGSRDTAAAQLHLPPRQDPGRRVMAGDDRGRAADDKAELGGKPLGTREVQASRRLVEQPQPRPGSSQVPGYRQPAALPQAGGRVTLAERGAQAQSPRLQPVSELGGFQRSRGDALVPPGPAERDVVQDAGGEDDGVLRHPANRLRPARPDVLALDQRPARRRRDKPGHDPEQARLPGAALADQAYPLPWADPQVDPIQHGIAAARHSEAHALQHHAERPRAWPARAALNFTGSRRAIGSGQFAEVAAAWKSLGSRRSGTNSAGGSIATASAWGRKC